VNEQNIEAVIKEVLIHELQLDAAQIAAADATMALLGRGIGLDSIEALRLCLGLESAFDIQIPDADLTVELFANFGALHAYIARRLGARQEPA